MADLLVRYHPLFQNQLIKSIISIISSSSKPLIQPSLSVVPLLLSSSEWTEDDDTGAGTPRKAKRSVLATKPRERREVEVGAECASIWLEKFFNVPSPFCDKSTKRESCEKKERNEIKNLTRNYDVI